MPSCPVCGVEIESESASADTGYGSEQYPPAQMEYDGRIYQFCSHDHREVFQDTPEQYVNDDADSDPQSSDQTDE